MHTDSTHKKAALFEDLAQRLQKAFKPTRLEILDKSDLHKGHAEAQADRYHIKLIIESPQWLGKDRLTCHRLIYQVLSEDLKTSLHAVEIDCG